MVIPRTQGNRRSLLLLKEPDRRVNARLLCRLGSECEQPELLPGHAQLVVAHWVDRLAMQQVDARRKGCLEHRALLDLAPNVPYKVGEVHVGARVLQQREGVGELDRAVLQPGRLDKRDANGHVPRQVRVAPRERHGRLEYLVEERVVEAVEGCAVNVEEPAPAALEPGRVSKPRQVAAALVRRHAAVHRAFDPKLGGSERFLVERVEEERPDWTQVLLHHPEHIKPSAEGGVEDNVEKGEGRCERVISVSARKVRLHVPLNLAEA
eukprot:6189165-Pleurochrysis_carterae.AAC.3